MIFIFQYYDIGWLWPIYAWTKSTVKNYFNLIQFYSFCFSLLLFSLFKRVCFVPMLWLFGCVCVFFFQYLSCIYQRELIYCTDFTGKYITSSCGAAFLAKGSLQWPIPRTIFMRCGYVCFNTKLQGILRWDRC